MEQRSESLHGRRHLWMIVAVILFAGGEAFSQGEANNTGSNGSAFLNIGVGAREMGMGGAVVSLVDDATALYWNPAGIASIGRTSVVAEHNQWVAQLKHEFFGAVIPLSDQFKLGASVLYFTSDDIEITTIDQPRGTGEMYNVSDVALGMTLGWAVTSDLSVGVTVKYIRNNLYNLSASGIAFDAGTQFKTGFNSLLVAFSAANLAGLREYRGDALDFYYAPPYPDAQPIRASYNNVTFSLPLTYRAGLSAELFELLSRPIEKHKVTVAADIVQPNNSPEKLNLGTEYSFSGTLFLRSGYVFNADELGFNAGIGVRLFAEGLDIRADYAFARLKHFDAVHRFGFSLGL